MSFRFDIVAARGYFEFSDRDWDKARFHLLEFQPAVAVTLIGQPPSRIRVVSRGGPADVAPGLLARIAELADTPIRVEMLDY